MSFSHNDEKSLRVMTTCVIKVQDECKELEQQAKGLEKENPGQAVVLYKEASHCYDKINDRKSKNSNLEKAAKLLKDVAKSSEDPVLALDYYEQSSQLYIEIDKVSEAEKIKRDAYLKFVTTAKVMKSEASKMDDIYQAEEKLKMASEYALLGQDENLSNECWIESGDQFVKMAGQIEEPLEALEIFKRAALNYRKGKLEKEQSVLREAADKFTRKGTDIYKTRKSIVNALFNYDQAVKIYYQIGSDQEALQGEQRIQEICEEIGFSKEFILHHLGNEGLDEISSLPTEIMSDEIRGGDQDLLETDIEQLLARSDEKFEPLKSEFPPAKTTETAEATIPTDDLVETFVEPSTPTDVKPEASISDIPPQDPQKKPSVDDEFDVKSYFDKKREEEPEQEQSIISATHETFHTKDEEASFLEKQVPSEVGDEIDEKKDFSAEVKISDQIVEILREQGYIGVHISTDAELLQVPEYQILSIIIRSHPISLDEIEAITNISSISLVLSNLQADDLIVQTNDYRWTISQKVVDNI
ncbi:MAG: hypothetical protein ACW99F_07325 [Candidatus Hodarchaeales archaeon]|jgi:tetratricopeptide (TPR) repeat protein